jgi:hypothetical protein
MLGMYPLGEGAKITNDVDYTKTPPFENQVAPGPSLENNALLGGFKPIPIKVFEKNTDDFYMRGFETMCVKANTALVAEFNKRVASPER